MNRIKQIISFVSGNLDKDESNRLLREIKSDTRLKNEYEKVKNVWALSTYDNDLDPLIVEKSFVCFRNRLVTNGKKRFLNILKYAAIVFVVFSLGLVSRQFLFPVSLPDGVNEIHVPNGEQAHLLLADSSKVWLNSGTRFRFPESFNGKFRTVYISGEAFFEVHKEKAPFIVSSEYGNIKVLGTKFNVRAYDNLEFQTTLNEGKIEFYNSSGKMMMAPGQQLRISTTGKFFVEKVDCRQVSSWTEGVVSFIGEPLSDVFKKLERHYNIIIKAEGTLTSIRFTGQIRDESVEEFMALINQTKPINYNYDRRLRTLTISERI